MIRRIFGWGNKKGSLVSFHLNVIESRRLRIVFFIRWKTVSNLLNSNWRARNDPSFIVSLFDDDKRRYDQSPSVIHRMTNVSDDSYDVDILDERQQYTDV